MNILKEHILEIAKGLDYKKIERMRQIDSNATDDTIREILKACIVDEYSILFFPGTCLQITPFGLSFERRLSRKNKIHPIAFPELTEKFLREAFTSFELIIYKICHILLEEHRAGYHFEKQKTRQRIRRLRSLLSNVVKWDEFIDLFDNIFFVRDAFAHSFIRLEDIKYCGTSLQFCFGESYTGGSMRDAEEYGARIFTDDLETLFEPVFSLFCQHQLKQIDARKFHKLCDRILMERSLSPGF